MPGMLPSTRIPSPLTSFRHALWAVGRQAAALAAPACISAAGETGAHHVPDLALEISAPGVLAGMFLGAIFPVLVSSITMNAVGDAAFEMIQEIRRQFKEIPGLMEGTAKPDSDRCIEIATTAALKRMIPPGVLAVGAPVVVGFLLGPAALGGMLGGALLGCVLLALTMANAGGAWDHAKKFVEKGNLGGKGSEMPKAAVVGDSWLLCNSDAADAGVSQCCLATVSVVRRSCMI